MSQEFARFNSRRSTVYSTKGIVASAQTLANAAGVRILEKGGNCVEAAIAVSAALCITEPSSTGIGGDCFALYYKNDDDKQKGQVLGLNATGRAAKNVTIQHVWDEHNEGKHMPRIPFDSVFSVTVPGAIAGWVDAYEKWGSKSVTLAEILQPAIDLAEQGFPVGEIASWLWRREIPGLINQYKITSSDGSLHPFIIDGKGPSEGDIVSNPGVAKALRLIGQHGKKVFYEGEIADAILKQTNLRNHQLNHDDLETHTSTFVEPIKLEFFGYEVWEIPPNGHGIVALLALGLIQALHRTGVIDVYKLKHNSVEYLHLLAEVCKLAFYDSDEYVTDQAFKDIPIEGLLSEEYLVKRSKLFDPTKIIDSSVVTHGVPDAKYKSDTVYLTVSDSNGEACSFINSVYEGFGSGILVPEYGFCLHNRGANFNLSEGLNNSLEGGKRPYHTIIPGMITKNGRLFASFGNMGGFAQPVCHVQHVLNLIIFGMTPQQSTDAPRLVLSPDPKQASSDTGRGSNGPVSTPITVVNLEEGIAAKTVEELGQLGHTTQVVGGYARSTFGRAQIIQKTDHANGRFKYAAGSDLRGDGAAVALV